MSGFARGPGASGGEGRPWAPPSGREGSGQGHNAPYNDASYGQWLASMENAMGSVVNNAAMEAPPPQAALRRLQGAMDNFRRALRVQVFPLSPVWSVLPMPWGWIWGTANNAGGMGVPPDPTPGLSPPDSEFVGLASVPPNQLGTLPPLVGSPNMVASVE